MEKQKKIFIVIIAVLTLFVSIIMITLGLVLKHKSENPTRWVLHSYGNNVALYNDDQIVEVYSSVLLDTLPVTDKNQLDIGIVFSTKEEAMKAMEDFDG